MVRHHTKRLFLLGMVLLLMVPLGTQNIHADTGDLLFTIHNPSASSSNFGGAVAVMDNGNIFVSASDTNSNSGTIYMYNSTGDLQRTINNPNHQPTYGHFGIRGQTDDKVFASGPWWNTGTAYIYDDAGNLSLTISNPTSGHNDAFGYSGAFTSEGKIIISSPSDDDATGYNTGAAYIFDSIGTLLYTINNPNPGTDDGFGLPVVVTSDDKIVIGSSNDDTDATNAGSVYIFDDTGTLLYTINNPTPATDDYFGGSIAATNDGKIIVGARSDDTDATNAGSVYIFDDTGTLLYTINNPTPATDDEFGGSIAATNDGKIIVGARSDDTDATNAGSVYIFDDTGTLLYTINNPTPATDDEFGGSIAATNDGKIIVGARSDDTDATNTGSVYIFDGIQQTTSSGQTTGNVEILTTCGIQLQSGAPISYGQVLPGNLSDEQTLTIQNPGNVNGTIFVSGTSWVDAANQTKITIDNTKYSISNGIAYNTKTSLDILDTQLIVMSPQVDTATFWQLEADLVDTLFSGFLTQTVNFAASC